MRILTTTEVKSQAEPSEALNKLARKWGKVWREVCEVWGVSPDASADTLREVTVEGPDGGKVPALPGLFLAFDEEDVNVIQAEAGNGSDRFALAFCREVGVEKGGWKPSDRATEAAAATVRYNYTGRKGEKKGEKVTVAFSGLHRVTPQKSEEDSDQK